jgi:hypothetical protein
VFNLDIPAGAADQVSINKRITDSTRFMMFRVRASWLVTGANAPRQNAWWPSASSEPVTAVAIAGGAMTAQLDYFMEIVDAGRGRSISNLPFPGDQLFRMDFDGVFADYPPIFDGGNEITVKITPTVAPAFAGTLYVCIWGIETRAKPEGAILDGLDI